MGCKIKIKMSKKVSRVPDKLPTKGAVRIRPISFHMDKIIDKYVVTGGGYSPVIKSGKREALVVARARVRVIKKHKMRRRKK